MQQPFLIGQQTKITRQSTACRLTNTKTIKQYKTMRLHLKHVPTYCQTLGMTVGIASRMRTDKEQCWIVTYHIAVSKLAPALGVSLLEQCAVVTNRENLQDADRIG